jgi:hypothetical protein
MALTAIMILSTTVFVFSMVTLSAVVAYSDSVYAREIRIQHDLDLEACADTAMLMKSKDYFWVGHMTLSDFGCVVNGN